jgi:inner membrane transporter RhtA
MLCAVYRPWRHSLTAEERRIVFAYGAVLGVMNLTFYMAIARIPLGIAVALEFTGPLAVAILSSHRPRDFVWAALAACGIVALLPITKSAANLDILGVVYALMAGVCWGLYIIFGQRAGKTLPAGVVTGWGMLIAACVATPFCFINPDPMTLNWHVVWLAVAVAVLSSALPYSLEMIALQRLPAKTFGIFMSVEPALAALLGLVILHEHLAVMQWLGIACIILASVGSTATAHSVQVHD